MCISSKSCSNLCAETETFVATGVISSTVDFMAQKVIVVGNVTREEVFKRVSRTGKQTAFWPEEPKEEKEEKKEEKEEKEEEKKEEETKEKTKEEPEKEV